MDGPVATRPRPTRFGSIVGTVNRRRAAQKEEAPMSTTIDPSTATQLWLEAEAQAGAGTEYRSATSVTYRVEEERELDA